MKSQIKLFALLLTGAALVLSSCSNDVLLADETGGNGPEASYSGKSVFITAGVGLPTSAGTRSQTDSPDPNDPNNNTNSNGDGETVKGEDGKDKAAGEDFEYGYDSENDVRTMLLVFATDASVKSEDNKFIAYSEVSGIEKAPTGAKYEFQVTAELKYEDLEAAYAQDGPLYNSNTANITGGVPVKVYAFCNYTANLEKVLKNVKVGDQNWVNEVGTVTENASPVGHTPVISNTIWASRAFLMTNYEETKVIFPAVLDGEYDNGKGGWDDFADKSTPFYINSNGAQPTVTNPTPTVTPIRVERSAARIDFRDGSKYADTDTPNKYDIITDVHKLLANDNGEYNGEKTDAEKKLFSVQLTRMALVNMSKNFYYLRRVSTDGQNADATIGGVETATNYVVDTDAADKKIVPPTKLGKIKVEGETSTDGTTVKYPKDYFNFPLFDEEGDYNVEGWYADRISDVLDNGIQDTWSVSAAKKPYKIWRYVTENTIPAGPENQITVQSTGIVFKGKIIAGDDIDETYSSIDETAVNEHYVSEEVRNALDAAEQGTINGKPIAEGDLPILYSFDGFLYGGWEELIVKAAKDGIGGRLYTRVENILDELGLVLVDRVYKPVTAESTVDEDDEDVEKLNLETAYLIVTQSDLFKDMDETKGMYKEYSIEFGEDENKKKISGDDAVRGLAADNDITVYEPSNEKDGEGWGYYCYYFYWNRHNDNEKSGIMGNMEFATVRNNVYKIYVESIAKFGHPRNKKDDPDPVDEEDKDEEPLRYIQVDVEVLPWVVRENKVTF